MNNQEKEIKVQEGLEVCIRVALHLKEQFPNDIMKIKDNTIIAYSKKNSRLIHDGHQNNGISGCQAYYLDQKPHRIIVKQKVLIDKVGWDCTNNYSLNPVMKDQNVLYHYSKCNRCGLDLSRFDGYKLIPRKDYSLNAELVGDIALVELICHELAHHRTSGHRKGFKIKYKRHWDFMKEEIKNGNFKLSDKSGDYLGDE